MNKMTGSVQGSAIDDSFEFLPDTPDAWVSGATAQARIVDYQYTVEPGDDRSAIDDRCPTEYGPYTVPFATPIIRPVAKVSTSQPIQPIQSVQTATDHALPATTQTRSSHTTHAKKRPSSRFVIRGKNGEIRVMNNPFVQRAHPDPKKSLSQPPEPRDEGGSNKDTFATAIQQPGLKIRIKGKNGEETIREFKTPLLFTSPPSKIVDELHSDDTTVVADDSVSVKNHRSSPAFRTPVRSIHHTAAKTRLPTTEERSGTLKVSELRTKPEGVSEYVHHKKPVPPTPAPSVMSTPLRMSGALPPASLTTKAPPFAVPSIPLSHPVPTHPPCPVPTAPPTRPATSSRSTPVASSPISTRLPPSKPAASLPDSAVQADATHTSSARLSNSQRTPSEFAAALDALNQPYVISEPPITVITTSKRSSLLVPSSVTWNDATQYQEPPVGERPTKISEGRSQSTQQSVLSSDSSKKPTSSETKPSSNAPSPRPKSEAKTGVLDSQSTKSIPKSRESSIAESQRSDHFTEYKRGTASHISVLRAPSVQRGAINSSHVSASLSVTAGAEQHYATQSPRKLHIVSQSGTWNSGLVHIPTTLPSKPVSQVSNTGNSVTSRDSIPKEPTASRTPSMIDANASQVSEVWETSSVPASENPVYSAQSYKSDRRTQAQPSSMSGTVNTKSSGRSKHTAKSGEHLSTRAPSMVDAISVQGSVITGAGKYDSRSWDEQSIGSRHSSRKGVLNNTVASRSVSQTSRMSRKSGKSSNRDMISQPRSLSMVDAIASQPSEQGRRSVLPSEGGRSPRLSRVSNEDGRSPFQGPPVVHAVARQDAKKDWRSVSSSFGKLEYPSMEDKRPINQTVATNDTVKAGASQSSSQSSKNSERQNSHSQDDNQSWKSASFRVSKPSPTASGIQRSASGAQDDAVSRVSRMSVQAQYSNGRPASSHSHIEASEKSQGVVRKDLLRLTSKERGQLEYVPSRQSYYRWKRPSDSLFSSSDQSSKDFGKGRSRSPHRSYVAEEMVVTKSTSHAPPKSEVMSWWDKLPPPVSRPAPPPLKSQKPQSEQRSQHGSTQEGSSVQGGVRLSLYESPRSTSGSTAGPSSRILGTAKTHSERSFSHTSRMVPSDSSTTNSFAPPPQDQESRAPRSLYAGTSLESSGGGSAVGTKSLSTLSGKTVSQDERTPDFWNGHPTHILDTIYEQREPSSRSQISTYSEQQGSTKYARMGDVTPHPLSPAVSNYTARKPPTHEPIWKKYRKPYIETADSESQSSGSRWYNDSSSESDVKAVRGRSSGSIPKCSGSSRDSVEAVLSPRTRQIDATEERAIEDWRSTSSKRTGSAIDALGGEQW